MKILFVMPRFHTNQIPIFSGFISKKHEVVCLTQYVGATEDHSIVSPILMKKSIITRLYQRLLKIIYKKNPSKQESKSGSYFLPSAIWLRNFLNEIQPDIIIVRERSITSLVIYAVARLLGINKVIVYNQSPYNREYCDSGIRRTIKNTFFPKVTYTPVLYKKYPYNKKKDYYIENDTFFIPFVAVTKGKCERVYVKDSVVRILDIGKYREYKNHFLIVETAKLLVERGHINDFTITIVGQANNRDEIDYLNRLNVEIKEKQLESIIKTMVNIPFDSMQSIYDTHDVFVLTSKSELASIAVLEAMANGLATVSTDSNGTASYIEKGITGEIFKTNDPADLANILEKYIINNSLVQLHGNQAFEKCRDDYCFEVYYNKFCEMIRREYKLVI